MKKMLYTLTCLLVLGFSAVQGQTSLYSEDFNGPSHSFNLNTADMASTTNGYNDWVVNNAYTGGSGTLICLGFPFNFTVANTVVQPAAIAGSPNSNYLHVLSDDAVAANIFCSAYRPADGTCQFAENYFSAMSADISTLGYASVNLDFWWICGGAATSYGEVYYSTNGGTSWTLLTSPISQYFNQTSWAQQSISNPAFDGQSQLRFGFRFVNLTASTGSEPAFSLDDVEITGTSSCTANTGSATASICQGGSILLGGAMQTMAGNYIDTLTNSGGCDSILTTALTVNPTYNMNATATICQGGSIVLGGSPQNSAGVYIDTYMTGAGCDSIVNTTLSVTAVDTSITDNGTTFTANATGATYQWYDCSSGVIIAGETNQDFNMVVNGLYAVIVTQNGCTDTSGCHQSAFLSIDENGFGPNLKAWPNPVSSILSVDLAQHYDQLQIKLVNINGQTLHQESKENLNSFRLDLSDYPQGIYLIQIQSLNQQATLRVTKQ